MNFLPRKELKPQVNLVSLVDVVLLLVIFFMLTSKFAFQSGIDVRLPQTKAAPATPPGQVTVTITREGRVYVDQQRVSWKQLLAVLKNKKESGKELLVVRADKNVRHARVVRVMDLARQAGIARLAIATEPSP